jgi:hypothetical protein
MKGPTIGQGLTNVFSNLLFRTYVGADSNNCYAYALDHYDTKQGHKLQPGELSGQYNANNDANTTSCSIVTTRAMADAAHMGWKLTPTSSSTRCPKGYHIMAVSAPGRDYHWYRKHTDVLYRIKHPRTVASVAKEFGVSPKNIHVPKSGNKASKKTSPSKKLQEDDVILVRGANVWSHKRGLSDEGPILKDSCGKFIKDPSKACRDYGYLDYHTVCKTFCLQK